MLAQELPYVIVAAVADDETSSSALYEAARAAQLHRHAELHLVRVVTAATARPAAGELIALSDALARAPEELRRSVDMLELQGPLNITAHIRVGSPSDCILAAAAELDADLLVVGTRKRRGLERAVFGSVSERVVQHAHCPVLVAMPKDHPRVARAPRIEPACPDCLAVRQSSTNQVLWCERHTRAGMPVHVYVPSDAPVTAVIR